MELQFDERTNLPSINLNEQDIEDARAIKKMLDSKGWKVLSKYMAVGRESIIDAIKDCVRYRDITPERAAVLKGWDECSGMADKIVRRHDEFIKARQEEENNDGSEPDAI